jgi:integrase/recombinase XerD
VTHLKKLMLEELERRNYAASTTRAYLRVVDEYARYFNRPPDLTERCSHASLWQRICH